MVISEYDGTRTGQVDLKLFFSSLLYRRAGRGGAR